MQRLLTQIARLACVLVLAAAMNTASTAHAATAVLPASGAPGPWRLTFDDEFKATQLDRTKWQTCFPWAPTQCTHDGNGELEWYQPSNVTLSSGALHLNAKREPVVGSDGKRYDYTSAMICTGPDSTKGAPAKFAFTYGYTEARVRIPSGAGYWPALWLLPVDGTWPPELDVAEFLGSAPSTIQMWNHWGTVDDHRSAGSSWTGTNFSAGWHTIALDWTPDHLTWYVDGIARRTFTDASAIPSTSMYLIANLAVGGSWPGSPTASTPFPAAFHVDYVRVWQRG